MNLTINHIDINMDVPSLFKPAAKRAAFDRGSIINSCMSKAEHYRLFARDARRWAAKKINGSKRSY